MAISVKKISLKHKYSFFLERKLLVNLTVNYFFIYGKFMEISVKA